MKVILCDRCGEIKTIEHATEIYTSREATDKMNKLESKLRNKGVVNPKIVDEIARTASKNHESDLTIERVVALRELDLCAGCEEDVLNYYDKEEKKEKIK